MIKTAAVLITITGCGICGILKAMRYKERTDILSDFIQAAEKMKIEMSYRRESLPELISRMADAARGTLPGRFFADISEIYGHRYGSGNKTESGSFHAVSVNECWSRAADEIYVQKCLTKSDRDAIRKLGHELGNCGIDGQERIFDLALAELRTLLSAAEEEKKTKGKMYISLGFTAGITIVILLI